ncbi:MAG TPA: gamma-glutamyl-gamma-aminobutyrate hydrolase family protein [Acidimicrobiales bacterium]|nr:gamma-glutamyl-gamma-aminobutyrate hydrolase family protein [Acidimicrobiales bacterium]
MEHENRLGPVSGITAGELVASYGVWKEAASLVPSDYIRSIVGSGGIPVVLSPVAGIAEALIERIDGLMLTGGVDVDATLFGAERHPKAQKPDQVRDRFEIALLDAAVARGIPVLAICRGIQVLNVRRGGTLHQHLPDVVANDEHMPAPGAYGQHPVRIDPASRLGAVIGRSEEAVPTHHHQAVDRIGEGLAASAWADDGIVEALEDPALPFLIAVQWHPEVGDDPSLFDGLIAAAERAGVLGRA